MALFRAVESGGPADRRLIDDPYASAFLSGGLRWLAAAGRVPVARGLVARLIDRRAPGPRVSAVVRTRLIDDAVTDALAAGAAQVVLLGAGYDSRAYRIDEIRATRVFEVDHPTTQAVKRRRIDAVLASLPGHVVWVPVDFLTEDFGAALLAAGYDPALASLFIWEGVTNYLDAATVDHTLRWIAANALRASRVSFTYVDRGLLDGSASFPGAEQWVASVARAGEPFTFGLDPGELEGYLAARGLSLLEDVSTAEALARLGARAAAMPAPPGFYHVALAEVAAPGA